MAEPDKMDLTAAERLLSEVACRPVPPPDADFLARLTADAVAAMPAQAHRSRPGWRDWVAALGGWPALGGMAMAGLVGLWIGVAPPAAVDALLAGALGDRVTVDLWAVDDPFGLEG